MKGNSTFVISLRLPDEVKVILQKKADDRGVTISEYLRKKILDSCNPKLVENVNIVKQESVNIVNPIKEPSHDVNIAKPVIGQEEFRKYKIDQAVELLGVIPKYDRTKHKAGDVVLMQNGRDWVRAIVPEMDAEGYKIYWE